MKKIKSLLGKNIIKYLMCSVFTALIEFVIIFCFKYASTEFGTKIVIANTIAIIISSTIHYLLTSKYVFKVSWSLKSIVVYIITFFLGLGIQNLVIWLSYNKLFASIFTNTDLLTMTSKFVSLVSSFLITYIVRKYLNSKIKEKEKVNE